LHIPARTALTSTALAIAISVASISGAAAQVASLRTPDPEAEPPAAAVSEELEGEDAILAFAACMRDNGIDMDDPQFGLDGGFFGGPGQRQDGVGIDLQGDGFQAAFESCGSYLEALQPDLDAEQDAEFTEQLVEYAECMRGEGIDFPDPEPGQGFGFGGPGAADVPFDPFSDEFQDASLVCQDLLDFDFGPGNGGGLAN
jgi:hypothetical protein